MKSGTKRSIYKTKNNTNLYHHEFRTNNHRHTQISTNSAGQPCPAKLPQLIDETLCGQLRCKKCDPRTAPMFDA